MPAPAPARLVDEVFTDPEALALTGFLAGYCGLTRGAYALDLRQYATWCTQLDLGRFDACRVHIEAFARDLDARGRSRATVARRLSPSPASTGTPNKKA